MMARCSRSLLLVAFAYLCFAPCLLATTGAADDVQKFVEGLRERRYYDTAAEYLESLANDSQLPAAVRLTLPYEQGLILIQSGLAARDAGERNRQFDLAQSKLKDFLTTNPTHDLSLQAQQQLANVLRFRADAMLEGSTPQRAALPHVRQEAGKLYDEARALYGDAAKRLRVKLDELPKGEASEKREQIGLEWLGARLNAARTMFEMGATRDAGEDKKKILTEAASQCGELYSKYPQRLAGITARYYEGRCYQELANREKALAAYGDLIADLPETDAAFRPLKTQAIKQSLECWLEDKNYAAAVEKAVPWAKSSRGAELRDRDWLAVKLSAATALKELASKAGPNDVKSRIYINDARELAGDVAKSSDRELQPRGRLLLAQLNRNPEAAAAKAAAKPMDVTVPEVKTFDEAFEKSEESTDEIGTAQLELEFLEKEPMPDKQEIAKAKDMIERNREISFRLLKRAVELAGQTNDADKLAMVYYKISYFHYVRGNYPEAAIFGEFVARKYSDKEPAKTAARVALAAIDAEMRQAQQAGEDTAYESGRLAEMADFISQKWPGQPEADAAFDALTTLYINQGEIEQATKTLERIKADSPTRAEAEARIGQALWSKYLRGLQQLRQEQAAAEPDAEGKFTAKSTTANELDALLRQAQTALERSIEVIRQQKEINPRMVLASLSLAQIYVQTSQSEKAVALLEDPKIGPVTLLNQKQPAAEIETIPAEIHKTAMRAYVGVEPQQIEKATAAMDALEKIYAGDADGENKFTQLLIGIAADMQEQLQALTQSGQGAKQQQQTQAFEQFLRKIAERKSGADFRTLAWVAGTYQNLANGISIGGKATPQAVTYYQRSAKAYEEILEKAKTNADFVPKDKLLVIKLELARANRGAGEYDKAIAGFAEVLKEKPMLLPVQVEAAKTYQKRGDEGKPESYAYAIKGGMKGEAMSIWGWAQLAIKTSRDLKQFGDFFHEARYNLSLCRRRFAATRTKPEDKKTLLELSKKDIGSTKLFDGTLGGEKWRPLYDKLLREIQKELGEQEIGLDEFKQLPGAAAADGKKAAIHQHGLKVFQLSQLCLATPQLCG